MFKIGIFHFNGPVLILAGAWLLAGLIGSSIRAVTVASSYYEEGFSAGLCQGWADAAGLVAGEDKDGNCINGSYPATTPETLTYDSETIVIMDE